MNDWNIQTRAGACEACGKPFADRQSYHTLLFDEKQDFRRLDVCEDCWQSQFSQGGRERKGFVSYWQGVFEAPPPPVDPIHKETAETLLRKLIEFERPALCPRRLHPCRDAGAEAHAQGQGTGRPRRQTRLRL